MTHKNLRLYYLACSTVLLGAEIWIGAYARGWVRTSLGDILVIPLLYCLVRIFTDQLPRLLPVLICGIGFLAEIGQYFKLYELLGFAKNSLGAIILGTGFTWDDLLSYLAGMLLIYLGISARTAFMKRKGVQS